MDPVSAISLAGSVVGIVDILAKSVNFLLNLQTKYKNADLTVTLLIGQLSTLKAALNQICEWITSSLVAVPQHEQLVLDLNISIEGCKVLASALDDRISSFDRNAAQTLNTLGKAQFLWEESGTTDYLNLLSNQINALNLLLTASQCRSVFEQKNLLRSEESRRTVSLVEDNMSSLLWLRDENSSHSRISMSTENSQMLDTRFDFDREVFNSKAYQVAIRSNMRQALSKKADTMAQRVRFPLGALKKGFNHVQLYNSSDAQTVREEHLGPSSSRDHVLLNANEDTQTVRKECLGPSSSRDHVLLDENEDTKTVSEQCLDSVPSRDELLGDSIVELRPDGPDIIVTRPTQISVSTKRRARRRFFFLPNGLSFRTSSAVAVPERSHQIQKEFHDTQLRIEENERETNPKVLILGSSQSGKSVLLKSMKLVRDGYHAYSDDDREDFKEVLFHHMIQRMRDIIEAMEVSGILLQNQENKQHVETILKQHLIDCLYKLNPDVAVAIRAFWSDSGVQELFKPFETWPLSSLYYSYFDSIERIALPDYVPTNQDILRIWVKTTCIEEILFPLERHTCRLFHVGGTRSERKKWVHVYEDITNVWMWRRLYATIAIEDVAVILFLVDISEYDELLYEDQSANRMQESLGLFDSICNSRWFMNTSIALFFTKIDCLEAKLAISPFNEYFPSFGGDSTNPEDVKDYIKMRFLSLDQNSKDIDVYFTSLESELTPGRTAIEVIEKILDLRKREKRDKDGKGI